MTMRVAPTIKVRERITQMSRYTLRGFALVLPGDRSTKMRSQDRMGWILFGGTVALVLITGVSSVMFPQAGVMYCTEGFGTCIVSPPRSGAWRVRDATCPAGQSVRFVSLGGLQLRRCHSILVTGFLTSLYVCPAACAK